MDPKTRGRDSRASFRRQLRRNRRWYLGAFDGDRLVGVVLGTHDTRKAWINRLAVDPDYRRRRIASRLVRECERRLRADTGLGMFAAIVELDNRASRSMFESMGYQGWKVWYMRKKRDPGI
jgi:ribosomal protein S18 acetylase RimI-like enzyme